MIDGWAHCPSTPLHLRRIGRPATFSPMRVDEQSTPKELAQHAKEVADLARFNSSIEERIQYRFEKHGKTSAGNQRFKCPARAQKVSCAGCPMSQFLPEDPPEVVPDDPEDLPAACAQETITIDASADPKLNQEEYWGSLEWQAKYGRRSRVEGTFGVLKSTSGLGRRGWTRQVGLAKTAFALTMTVAAYNLTTLLSWASESGDTRDPLALIDLTDYGFVELDPDGNLLEGVPPPQAAAA